MTGKYGDDSERGPSYYKLQNLLLATWGTEHGTRKRSVMMSKLAEGESALR